MAGGLSGGAVLPVPLHGGARPLPRTSGFESNFWRLDAEREALAARRERRQRTRVELSDSLLVSSVRRRCFPTATTSSPAGSEFRRSSTVEERRMSSRIRSDRLICSESRARRFAIVRFSSAPITQNVSCWQVPNSSQDRASLGRVHGA
jgi:hypothetical protein